MNSVLVQVMPALVDVLSVLVGALATWLAAAVTRYVQSKTKNELVRGASAFLIVTAEKAVASAQQQVVDQLKKDLKDGKIDKEEADKVLSLVKREVVANVKNAVSEKYAQVFSDTTLTRLVDMVVESEVKGNTAVPFIIPE